MVVGINVARIRQERGLSQDRLARHAGVGRAYLSSIENGGCNPTIVTLTKLADALGVDMVEFIKKTNLPTNDI